MVLDEAVGTGVQGAPLPAGLNSTYPLAPKVEQVNFGLAHAALVAQLDAEGVELGDVVELGRWASPGRARPQADS